MNTGKGYGWRQLSQWDTRPNDVYIKSKKVKTGLSESVCSFELVNRIDQGNGYLRCELVKKVDITIAMLKEAGSL